jgi:Putative transposase
VPHRVAISNHRLIKADDKHVTFTWKDYRAEERARSKTMTLATHEFIRRFLIHVLPKGLHRIRHYGLFANGNRAENLAKIRELLAAPLSQAATGDQAAVDPGAPDGLAQPCPCCRGRMVIIETFTRGATPRDRSSARVAIRIDTS